MSAQRPEPVPAGAPDLEALKADGSCRHVVGVWGAQNCPELVEYIHCRNCPVYSRTGRRMLDRPRPPEVTADEGERLREPVRAKRSLIVFSVGGTWLALPTTTAREVVGAVSPRRVPHRSDPRLLGIASVHGELVPCMDLSRTLGLAALPSEGPVTTSEPRRSVPMTLVAQDADATWALPVDAVAGISQVPEADFAPIEAAGGDEPLVHAIVTLPVGRTRVIDTESLWKALREACS